MFKAPPPPVFSAANQLWPGRQAPFDIDIMVQMGITFPVRVVCTCECCLLCAVWSVVVLSVSLPRTAKTTKNVGWCRGPALAKRQVEEPSRVD